MSKEYYSQYEGIHVVGDGDLLVAEFTIIPQNREYSPRGTGHSDAEAIADLAITVLRDLEQLRGALRMMVKKLSDEFVETTKQIDLR